MENPPPPGAQAFAAVAAFPALHTAVAPALERQAAQLAATLAVVQERPRLLAALAGALREPAGGLVVLEGAPGSGVTGLLAALAARHPLPLWLAPATGADGLLALYAQLVALRRPAVPLLDPTATTDPAAFERLLAEIAGAGGPPVALAIDDLYAPGEPARPGPTPLPAELPRGVTLLLGCTPGAPLPYAPVLRLRLPDDDPDLLEVQARALAAMGCPPGHSWSGALLGGSRGNMLYLRLALAMLREGRVAAEALPQGLDALLQGWWVRLTAAERRCASLLAAAGEPLPLAVAARLLDADPAPALARWERLGLVELGVQPVVGDDPGDEPPVRVATFAHGAIRAMLAQLDPQALTAAHDGLVAAALTRGEEERGERGAVAAAERYLARQLARHAALAPRERRAAALPALVSREWLRAHERRGELAAALEGARWELRAAAVEGPELRLVRAAAFAGGLASRARALAPDVAVEALSAGLEVGGREAALKRVLDSVERLPDGGEKAVILRRLGEICYGVRMRSSAMRLLSRALDLEAAPVSRAWRDSREALQAALAEAALALGEVEVTLAIAERIEHFERRAMVETQVVRRLLAAGDRDRAQRLARAIHHESMGAWARAETGVELLRAGDPRGAMLLEEIELETVAAWAQIELACDEAARDEAAALRRIEALPTQGQRDRGLAALARALAAAGNDGAALAAAEQIAAVEVRAAALIELRLSLEGLVAMLALERATRDIGAVTGDDRAPLVAALAAALAALGRSDRALALIGAMPAGEERDRAVARTAVALAQRGDHEEAMALIEGVDDGDERAWAYEEFARQLAAAGRWAEAVALAGRIAADDRRAGAAADLAIERARAGEPAAALAMALAVEQPGERARALTVVAPGLVAAGGEELALEVASRPAALHGAEARGRYLAAVGAALAEGGRTEAAAAVVARIRRPADRARAGAALALALARQSPALARTVLGAALRAAAVGREETYRALELAAPALAALGGARLIDGASVVVDAIDRW